MNRRIALVVVGPMVLLYGIGLVCLALDRGSHSASDAHRPFIITMLPVWLIAILGARTLLSEAAAGAHGPRWRLIQPTTCWREVA